MIWVYGLSCAPAANAPANSVPAKISDEGLLACWALDDGKGDAAQDLSGKGNHGKITSPNWVDIASRKNLLFVPCQGAKVSAAIGTVDKGLTMEAWFFTSSTGTHSIIQRGGWQNRLLIANGKVEATIQLLGGKFFCLGAGEKKYLSKWTHLALTYDGGKARFYVDGELKQEVSTPGKLMPGPGNSGGSTVNVGAESGHFHFSGFVRDVRIYGRALAEQEITAQFAGEKSLKDKDNEYARALEEYFPLEVKAEGNTVFLAEDEPEKIGRTFAVTSLLNAPGKFELKFSGEITDFYGVQAAAFDLDESFSLAPGERKIVRVEVPFQNRLGIYSIKGKMLRKNSAVAFPVSLESAFCVIRRPVPLTREERLKSPFGIIVSLFWRADSILPYLKMLEYSGMRWAEIYTNLDWPAVERKKGIYDFSEADKMCEYLDKAGLLCMASMLGENRIYENCLDPEAFGKYCRALAEHFKGRILAWMIWGEPHNNGFGPVYDGRAVVIGKWLKPYLYFSMVAAENIKMGDPQALTISGAMDTYSILEALLAGGMGAYYDIIGVEPYCWAESSKGFPELDGKPAVTICDDGAELRELLRKYNAPRRMWTTEVGWQATRKELKGGVDKLLATQRMRAALMVREYVISLASGIEKVFYIDWGGRSETTGYGIVDDNLNPSPAYTAYSNMSRLLEGAAFERRLALKAELRGYIFKRKMSSIWFSSLFRKRENMLVLWSVKDEDGQKVELPDCDIRCVDIQGNEIYGKALNISPLPVYLIGTPENVAEICRYLESKS